MILRSESLKKIWNFFLKNQFKIWYIKRKKQKENNR